MDRLNVCCLWLVLLASALYSTQAQRDCLGPVPYQGTTAATASARQVIAVSGNDTVVDRMRAYYQNCSRIFGRLTITDLADSDDASFLNDIQEVYGFVDIFHNTASTISLPNLRVVRGLHLLKNEYAVAIGNNPNLKNFYAPQLHAVDAGAVLANNNPSMQCVDKIGWADMRGGKTTPADLFQNTGVGNVCPCNSSCPNQCFGAGTNNCYTNTSTGCGGLRCQGRCDSTQATPFCCHRQCTGGCTGYRDTQCLACRSFRDVLSDGRIQCVERCPLLTTIDDRTNEEVPNKNGRYVYQLDCIRNCTTKGQFSHGQLCVKTCPLHYAADVNGVCTRQAIDHARSCFGTDRSPTKYLTRKWLYGNMTNCTRVVGDLNLKLLTFIQTSGNGINEMDLEVLSSVQEITGCVRFDSLGGDFLKSASFLRNVRSVGTCIDLQSPTIGLSAIGGSNTMRYLGMGSLKTVGGHAYFKGSNLCYLRTLNWTATGVVSAPSQAYILTTSNCTGDKCHSLCGVDGCLGPGPADCFSCKDASYRGICISACSVVASQFNRSTPVFQDSTTKECQFCHPNCLPGGCTGPTNEDCLQCPDRMFGKACVTACPSETYGEPSGNKCLACNPACQSQPGLPLNCTGGGTFLGQGGCTECQLAVFSASGQLERCVLQCPALITYDSRRYSPTTGVQMCEYCHSQCHGGCDGTAASNCAACKSNYRILGTTKTCVAACDSQREYAAANGQCLACDSQCQRCTGPTDEQCINCTSAFVSLGDGRQRCMAASCDTEPYNYFKVAFEGSQRECLRQCENGTYALSSRRCVACNPRCASTCSNGGSSLASCNGQCKEYEEQSNCVQECSPSYSANVETRKCAINSVGGDEESRSSESSTTSTALIGGAVGGALFVVIIVVLLLFAWYRRQANKAPVCPDLELPGSDNPTYGVPLSTIMDSETLQPKPAQADPNMARLETALEHEIRIGQQLGEGAFGTVYEGTWTPRGTTDLVDVAVKVLKENTGAASNKEILDEAVVMATVTHPHLVRLLCICMAPRVMLLTELMGLGSLLAYLRNRKRTLTGETLLLFGKQIAEGMGYLESKRLIHRDLAARNVLVAEHRCVKITDFGLARLLDVGAETFQHDGGKMPVKWLAPECMTDRIFTHQTDVWSFGVTMWEVLTFGNAPFKGYHAKEIFSLLMNGSRLPKPRAASRELFETLEQCWSWEADERPTFSQLGARFDVMCANPGPFCVTKADREGRSFMFPADFESTAPELGTIDDDGYEGIGVFAKRQSTVSSQYDNFGGGSLTSETAGNSFPSRDTLPGNLGSVAAIAPKPSRQSAYGYDNLPEGIATQSGALQVATPMETEPELNPYDNAPMALMAPSEDPGHATYDNMKPGHEPPVFSTGYEEPLPPATVAEISRMSARRPLHNTSEDPGHTMYDNMTPGHEPPVFPTGYEEQLPPANAVELSRLSARRPLHNTFSGSSASSTTGLLELQDEDDDNDAMHGGLPTTSSNPYLEPTDQSLGLSVPATSEPGRRESSSRPENPYRFA